jgi:exopolysaccharide biosynthesis polyprenyl glycosylphosphotransferase
MLISVLTWVIFYQLREWIYQNKEVYSPGYWTGMIFYTAGWSILHHMSGAYLSLYEKSRLNELGKTIFVSLIGCMVLLFVFILKNPQENNSYYYQEFLCLLIPHASLSLFCRWFILKKIKSQFLQKKVYFHTLMIGTNHQALDFFQRFNQAEETSGHHLVGFYSLHEKLPNFPIPVWDTQTPLHQIISEYKIEEVIITLDPSDRKTLQKLLQQLSDRDVNIKISPDATDILTRAIDTSNVMGIPLMDVHAGLMPSWQKQLKRILDLAVSFFMLIFLFPLMLYIALRVMLSSKGPVFFRQERIGRKGKPFCLFKFRSMYTDAESVGPMLSYIGDPRITPWGRIMRKWRLDELPQLWNVIRGDMSLVGPRPERRYYIDEIIKTHPEYLYLLKVKPGITGWGMVRYGYASTTEEMINRMPFDLCRKHIHLFRLQNSTAHAANFIRRQRQIAIRPAYFICIFEKYHLNVSRN